MKSKQISLSLVVPVFNEAVVIPVFVEAVIKTFSGLHDIILEIIFIDDGSTDNSLDTLLCCKTKCPYIKIIELSRNFGKEAALTAGFGYAKGEVVVPIDVDLQHPLRVIFQMLEKWGEGYDVVLAKRNNRSGESLIKRVISSNFYTIHNLVSDQKIPKDVGDFRLMDKRVVDALNCLPESRRFMKGLFSWVGFKTISINYEVEPRALGVSKFNGWKLWNFAIEGITSFSTAPLRIWTYLGMMVTFSSFIYAIYITYSVFRFGIDVPGYPSLMVAIIFFSGIQLMGIGVIGEYLGRAYIESKRRPSFIIRKIYD